jgi:hypothetical protein
MRNRHPLLFAVVLILGCQSEPSNQVSVRGSAVSEAHGALEVNDGFLRFELGVGQAQASVKGTSITLVGVDSSDFAWGEVRISGVIDTSLRSPEGNLVEGARAMIPIRVDNGDRQWVEDVWLVVEAGSIRAFWRPEYFEWQEEAAAKHKSAALLLAPPPALPEEDVPPASVRVSSFRAYPEPLAPSGPIGVYEDEEPEVSEGE